MKCKDQPTENSEMSLSLFTEICAFPKILSSFTGKAFHIIMRISVNVLGQLKWIMRKVSYTVLRDIITQCVSLWTGLIISLLHAHARVIFLMLLL